MTSLFDGDSCTFSPCRQYRYTLWRPCSMGDDPYVMFIGLNPSTADETNDDPTIRRCIRFAKDWGYGGLCMTNLFAFRATDPDEMKRQALPEGPENDATLVDIASRASLVVAAWGVHGDHRDRDLWAIKAIDRPMLCLGRTKHGHPRHPLYVPANQIPFPFRRSTELDHRD